MQPSQRRTLQRPKALSSPNIDRRYPRWMAGLGMTLLTAVGPVWAPVDSGPLHAQPKRPAVQEVLVAIDAGRFDDAESLLRRHLADGGKGPAVHFLLGEVLMQQYRPAEAEEPLRRAVAGRADRPRWHHRLAVCLAQQGQCRAALPWLDRAIALESTPERLFDRAQCQLAGGHFQDAEADLLAVVDTAPDHHRGWFELGLLAKDRGDDALAQQRFHRALSLDPENIEAGYQTALSSLAMGQPEAAIDGLRRVLQKIPGHTGAVYNLGRALQSNGQTQDSREVLAEFRRLSQRQDLLDNHLQFLQLHATDIDARLNSGKLLLSMGRVDEAIGHLEIARQLAPEHLPTHRLLVEAYGLTGRSTEAYQAQRDVERLAGLEAGIEP